MGSHRNLGLEAIDLILHLSPCLQLRGTRKLFLGTHGMRCASLIVPIRERALQVVDPLALLLGLDFVVILGPGDFDLEQGIVLLLAVTGALVCNRLVRDFYGLGLHCGNVLANRRPSGTTRIRVLRVLLPGNISRTNAHFPCDRADFVDAGWLLRTPEWRTGRWLFLGCFLHRVRGISTWPLNGAGRGACNLCGRGGTTVPSWSTFAVRSQAGKKIRH